MKLYYCANCDSSLPATDFLQRKGRIVFPCKECKSKYNKRWREQNKDYHKNWRAAHPDYGKDRAKRLKDNPNTPINEDAVTPNVNPGN